MWRMTSPFAIELVLVGIEQQGGRIGIDGNSHADERLLAQQVVLVEEADVFSGRQCKRIVGARGDSAIAGPEVQLDSRVCRSMRKQPLAHLGPCGCVVCDAEFPAVVDLLPHRFDRGVELAGIGVVTRHQYREQRPPLQHGGTNCESASRLFV